MTEAPNQTAAGAAAENLGRLAFQDGKGLDDNPFSWLRDGNKRQEWSHGWLSESNKLSRRRAKERMS